MARSLFLGAATLLVTLVVLLPRAHAGKYNLTRAVASPLVAAHVPPTQKNCLSPGACFPVNQTIPGQSFWYWCGFWSTHKTMYYIKSTSATANFSGSWLMRKEVVKECAIPNLSTVENCPTVPESSCTKKRTCQVRTFGLVFSDDICLVIINNKASNIIATIQVNNFYSSSRYYGTVFTIFIAVVGLLAVLAKVAYDFYVNIRAPVNVHKEPIRPRRNRDLTEQLIKSDDDQGKSAAVQPISDNAPGSTFASKLRGMFGRGTNKTAAAVV